MKTTKRLLGLLLALVELGFVVCRRIAKEDVAA